MSVHQSMDKIAELVADGVEIDWAAWRTSCRSEDRSTLERLAILQQLQQAMRIPEITPEPLEAIQHWGHLRLLEQLGRGASSIVFRAHDPTLNREVALKLRLGGPRRPGDHAAWIEEARRLARVRHPNVVAVHGADVHEGIAGLWCDLVDGETLGTMTVSSPATATSTLNVAEALLSAVDAVHRAGLVHGDIKPDNVMCEHNGRLLLMDFGAAARFDHGDDTLDRAGTPLAMAPERFEQARLTQAADVFGIGVVLFYWLEGRYPVAGADATEIEQRWKQGVQPALSKRCRPHAMRRLVLQMLAVNPADRPTVNVALARVSSMRRAPARRLRVGAALTVIGGLSVALLIALTSLQSAQRAQQETAAVNRFLSDVLASPRRTRLGPNLPLSTLLEDSAISAERQLAEEPAALAQALGTIGTSLVKLQQHDRAEPLLVHAERLQLELHRPVAAAEVRLARAELAMQQNRFDDARELYQQNFSAVRQSDARAAALQARTQIGLAHVELAAGELSQARKEIDDALAMLETDQPVVDHDSLRALTMLAAGEIDLRTGRFASAQVSYAQASAFFENRRGLRHHNTLLARNGLIEALDRLGQLDQAARLATENVSITIDWLGPSDRLSIMARDALANILSRQGNPERAMLVNQAGLDALATTPSHDPLLTLQLQANQVAYLLDAGRPRTALVLSEKLLPRLIEMLGVNHTLTLITGLNQAEALLDVKRPAEAESTAKKLNQQIRDHLGDSHLFAHVAGYLIGASLSAQGAFEHAEPHLLGHHAALSDMLGPDHPITLKAACLLIIHYLKFGKNDEANSLLDTSYASSLSALGAEHIRTRDLALLRQRR